MRKRDITRQQDGAEIDDIEAGFQIVGREVSIDHLSNDLLGILRLGIPGRIVDGAGSSEKTSSAVTFDDATAGSKRRRLLAIQSTLVLRELGELFLSPTRTNSVPANFTGR